MADFLAYQWFPSLINVSVTAGIVILVVLAARVLLRRAPKVFSYALWSVVLFRLLCPVSVSTPLSLLMVWDVPVQSAGEYTSVVEYVQPDLVHQPEPQVQFPLEAVNNAINEVLPKGEEQTVADPLEAPMAFLSGLWLLGALLLLMYGVWTYGRLRRRLTGAAPLEKGIYQMDGIPSPFVLGVLRPRIYLPSGLAEEERAYILCHERHHIRRLDHVTRLLGYLALCIHWFNPLVWLAFVLSGKDMELSCDEAVVGKMGEEIRAGYAASLLKVAAGQCGLARVSLAFGKGDTKSRIQNLVRWRRPGRWTMAAGCLLCAGLIAVCMGNPPKEEPDHTGETGILIQNTELSYSDPYNGQVVTIEQEAGWPVLILEETEEQYHIQLPVTEVPTLSGYVDKEAVSFAPEDVKCANCGQVEHVTIYQEPDQGSQAVEESYSGIMMFGRRENGFISCNIPGGESGWVLEEVKETEVRYIVIPSEWTIEMPMPHEE